MALLAREIVARLRSKNIKCILHTLAQAGHEPMCASDFFRKNQIIKRGTIYHELRRMQKMGLVWSYVEDKHPRGRGSPRRLYTVTNLGHEVEASLFGRIKAVETISSPLFASAPEDHQEGDSNHADNYTS